MSDNEAAINQEPEGEGDLPMLTLVLIIAGSVCCCFLVCLAVFIVMRSRRDSGDDHTQSTMYDQQHYTPNDVQATTLPSVNIYQSSNVSNSDYGNINAAGNGNVPPNYQELQLQAESTQGFRPAGPGLRPNMFNSAASGFDSGNGGDTYGSLNYTPPVANQSNTGEYQDLNTFGTE